MITRAYFTNRILLALTILGIVGAGQYARAQEPEEPEDNAPAVRNMVFVLSDEQFDQWAFGGRMTGATVRNKLDSLLTMQIEDIDRSCTLTEAQKNKLRLAGRGDMKRFLDRVEEKRALLKGLKIDQNKMGEIYQQIQPLQKTLSTGLFMEGSIFFKSIGKTLTAEQAACYDKALQEKKTYLYRAKIDLLVAHLTDELALRSEQRDRLVKLLLEETRPPRKYGEAARQVMLFQMAKLPEATVKAILDDDQWRSLRPVIAQWKANERILRANGYVPEDAAPEGNANPAEPAAK